MEEIDGKRFFEQAFQTLIENPQKCRHGNTVDAYNKKINDSGISPTITTRPEGFKTAILIIEECADMQKATKCEMVGMLDNNGYEKMHDISRRVYSGDGVAPTLHTCGGGNLEPKIIEQIALDEQNGRLRTDGTVGTLTTDGSSPKHNNRIVEVIVAGNYSPSGHSAATVVDADGAAPTVMENHGTVTAIIEPRTAAMRGRNADNPSDRRKGIPTEQRLEIGGEVANTLTTVQKDSLVVEPTPEQGVIEPMAQIDINGDSLCVDNVNLRVRKLTERECFRLMGVTDADFKKVQKNQSKSSLYHLAGDSIVTACLMAIFGEMLDVDYAEKIKKLTNGLGNK